VYDAHFDHIARYCLRRLPEVESHDAVSEVFLVAWRRIDQMPTGGETLPWLYGVARNVVRNAQRSRRRTLRVSARIRREPHYAQSGPEIQVVRHEEDEMLLWALEQLKPDDREVLRLRT
jgi:RNA polymerase sigma-70 factor (ECF subfamily)